MERFFHICTAAPIDGTGPRWPGDGRPDLVHRILTETADFLDVIVDRTIDAIEDGSSPHVGIVRGIELPVSDSPWLQPVYDEGEFIVRTIVRYFGGWWAGRPSELKPAPRTDLARQFAQLSDGSMSRWRVGCW